MERTMTPQRLEHLLAAYGSDSRRWPEEERESALTLVAQSPVLRRLVEEAQALDSALSRVRGDVSAAVVARVAARIEGGLSAGQRRSDIGGFSWRFLWNMMAATWPRAAGFAGIAMLGIVTGLSSDPSAFTNADGAFDDSFNTSETSLMGVFETWSE